MEIYATSKKLSPSEIDIPEKSDKANKPQPAEEVLVKTIDLGTGDNSKTTTPNRKTHSSTSSGLTATSSRGSQVHARGAQGVD
jgi:hypothetical protein